MNLARSRLIPTLTILSDHKALIACLTWPKFSLTSYQMVRGLYQQGIRPQTVIDVGANVGQFAVACSRWFPSAEIFAFEPNPQCAARLTSNLRGVRKVSIFPVALGNEEGIAKFHVNAHTHSSSVLPLGERHCSAFPEATETETIEVKINRLDALLSESQMQGPVLLKLDVQGYEVEVLKGAQAVLRRVDYLVVEMSFEPMYEGEITFRDGMQLVEGYGFRFVRPVGFLRHPKTDEILQMDALFQPVVGK